MKVGREDNISVRSSLLGFRLLSSLTVFDSSGKQIATFSV